MSDYPLKRLDELKEKRLNRLKNNREKSIEKRKNRLLSKSKKVLDWSRKSCEFCKIDFSPSKINERFCSINCLKNFFKVNFMNYAKVTSSFRGDDWEKKRLRCLDRDGFECVVCGESLGVDVHHIEPYRIFKDNELYNLVTLCSVHHPLEDIYFRKWHKPSSWLIKFQKGLKVSS